MNTVKVHYKGKVPVRFEKKYGTIEPDSEIEMDLGDFMDLHGNPEWVKLEEKQIKAEQPKDSKKVGEEALDSPSVSKSKKRK